MKYVYAPDKPRTSVRPLAGAGIEIYQFLTACQNGKVRPLAGAGIEIGELPMNATARRFAPSRGRELKYVVFINMLVRNDVRPLAGAGIEICGARLAASRASSPPRGGGN